MAKPPPRWAIWKIAAATAACALASALLFWLSALANRAGASPTTQPDTRASALTFPSFLMMFAIIAVILAALGLLWLAVRIWEARKPAWERGSRKKRR